MLAGQIGTGGDFAGRLNADGQGTGREFDEIVGFRMPEIPLFFRKTDLPERLPDALPPCNAGGDEIQIVRAAGVFGIDADAGAPHQHDIEPFPAQVVGDKRGQFAGGEAAERCHSGFARRRGRRRSSRSLSCNS